MHRPVNQKAARAAGADPDSLLPGVHRVASLCKRWLLGTHQGPVDAAHLPAYLNEFVFRFQPPPLDQPGHGLLPVDGTGRQARAGALLRPARQQETARPAAERPWVRAPAEPRSPSG